MKEYVVWYHETRHIRKPIKQPVQAEDMMGAYREARYFLPAAAVILNVFECREAAA